MYTQPGVSYHVVYAGSAPGTHLAFLDELFENKHTWELIDPGEFDMATLNPLPNFRLRNEFFTNNVAYDIAARRMIKHRALKAVFEHVVDQEAQGRAASAVQASLQSGIGTLDVARQTEGIPSVYEEPLALPAALNALCQVAQESKPVIFISDIRTGRVGLPNFEEHVYENMKAQQCWTEIIHGDVSMLKFRTPYTRNRHSKGKTMENCRCDADGCMEYLRGELLLPIWTRPTSTEGRLVVPRGAGRCRYNVAKVESQFFFFNAVVREQVHFNHILSPHRDLDGHFDSAAEVEVLCRYCLFVDPKLRSHGESLHSLRAAVERVSKRISQQLKMTFADAIRKREALMLRFAPSKSESDNSSDGGARPAEARPREELVRRLLNQARMERARLFWAKNIFPASESKLPGAKIWCLLELTP
jgi:cap3/cap4 methyltransferase